MIKTNPVLTALCLLSLALPCHAETFTLKDGTTLDAKVISETGDTYVLEVQITKSIRDERRVAKADVIKRVAEQPDLKAFEAIGKLVPTADLFSAEDYPQHIAAVEKFLKDHRGSSKTKDAKAILETLKAEATQVDAGGVKLNGKIVAPAEYQVNAYDLDARVEETKIRRLVDNGQFLAALRAFADFDRDFRTTRPYGAVAPLIRQVVQNEVAEAKQAVSTYGARVKGRDAGLAQMTPEGRNVTENAIKEETAQMAAQFKAEKEAKQNWVTTSPFNKDSLDATVTFGGLEQARLAAVKPVPGVDGGKAYRDLYAAVNNGDNAAAISAALAAAKTALVPARYLAPLEALAKGRK